MEQIFNQVNEIIDNIAIGYHLASYHISGDFHIHHKEMLTYLHKTGEVKYLRYLSVAYEQTQTIESPSTSLMYQYIFLSCCSEKYVTSNHSLVSVNVDAKLNAPFDVLYHRKIFRYTTIDWNRFRSYIVEYSLTTFFETAALNSK